VPLGVTRVERRAIATGSAIERFASQSLRIRYGKRVLVRPSLTPIRLEMDDQRYRKQAIQVGAPRL
jgi:hypothetical protein